MPDGGGPKKLPGWGGLRDGGTLQNGSFKNILQDRKPEGTHKGGLKGRLMMEGVR